MFKVGRPVLLLISLAGPFLLLVVDAAINYFLTGTFFNWGALGRTREFHNFTFLTYLLYNLLFFGYGEETGW
jgi:hypothetical protein